MREGISPWPGILFIILLIFFKALARLMKTVLENVNESAVKDNTRNGGSDSLKYLKLFNKRNRLRDGLEFMIGLGSILIGIVYTVSLLPVLGRLEISGIKEAIPDAFPIFASAAGTVALVFLMVLFGDVLPRKIAAKHSEIFFYQMKNILLIVGWILAPFSWLMDKMIYFVLRMFGSEPSDFHENVTEEELISMVKEGHEQGIFEADEAEMISNIIELNEKEAQDIMTPKKRIIAVNAMMTAEEALRFMIRENYSRYPLYEKNRDNIIGILHLKDVITAYLSENSGKESLQDLAREAYYVPDTQSINLLFREMKQKNIHMAVVIDEYGQTAGIVAMEDFLEEIVGNIQDEYDEEEKMILLKENDAYIVRGSIRLEELQEDLNISLEHEDFETLNGLLISILDRIPMDGETEILEYQGYCFEILETVNKMIEQVRISKITEDIQSEEEIER